MTGGIGPRNAVLLAAIAAQNTRWLARRFRLLSKSSHLDLATSLVLWHAGPLGGSRVLAGHDSVEGMCRLRCRQIDSQGWAGNPARWATGARRHRLGLARRVIDQSFEATRSPIEFAVGYLQVRGPSRRPAACIHIPRVATITGRRFWQLRGHRAVLVHSCFRWSAMGAIV